MVGDGCSLGCCRVRPVPAFVLPSDVRPLFLSFHEHLWRAYAVQAQPQALGTSPPSNESQGGAKQPPEM